LQTKRSPFEYLSGGLVVESVYSHTLPSIKSKSKKAKRIRKTHRNLFGN